MLIHHLALTAADPAASAPFYDTLLGLFGYRRTIDAESLKAWEGPDFELILYRAKPELRDRAHTLYQPGFHHLALQAENRAQVDAAHEAVKAVGAVILDAPREYPNYPGDYYAVFFLDPDGLKLEVMTM
jgi:glyoxylase I family protein